MLGRYQWKAAWALIALVTLSLDIPLAIARNSIACASSIGELPIQDLVVLLQKKHGKIVLDRKSTCLKVREGMSLPTVLLHLPRFTEPYSISIRGVIGRTVLVPRAELLNGEYQVHRSLGVNESRQRADSVELPIFINLENAEEQYLLLYADPDALGQDAQRTTMDVQSSYIGTGTWISGKESHRVINYVETGSLVLELQGLQLPKSKP